MLGLFFALFSFFVSLCFFDRFQVRFGRLLGSILGAQMAPSWPKFAPRRLSERIFCQKANFQKNQGKPMVFEGFCSPRWHPKRPKIAPRHPQEGLEDVFFRCRKMCSILVRFELDFGSLLGALLAPKSDPDATKK